MRSLRAASCKGARSWTEVTLNSSSSIRLLLFASVERLRTTRHSYAAGSFVGANLVFALPGGAITRIAPTGKSMPSLWRSVLRRVGHDPPYQDCRPTEQNHCDETLARAAGQRRKDVELLAVCQRGLRLNVGVSRHQHAGVVAGDFERVNRILHGGTPGERERHTVRAPRRQIAFEGGEELDRDGNRVCHA